MQSLVQWFMQLDFRKAIWLAPLAWCLHELEEWNIDTFGKQHFLDEATATIDHRALWIGLGIAALNGVIWTAITAWPKNPRFGAFLTLPFFVYFSFANALQHIYWTIYFQTYAPGVITAVLVVMPVVVGLTIKALREKLIPPWYVALLYATVIPTLVATVLAGNQHTVLPWPIKIHH
jgi:hypothetical protein